MCRMNNNNSMNNVSPVLMIRGVPDGTTTRDLDHWGSQHRFFTPEGMQKATTCAKSLVLADKQIGFVQMGSPEEAVAVMNIYRSSPRSVSIQKNGVSHNVNLAFSDKREITASTPPKNQIANNDRSCRVLLCVLSKLQVAIQLSEVFWIFSQFGTVMKISSFIRNMKNQVLVMFANREQANVAMTYLNGKHVEFNTSQGVKSSCQFSIVPSKLSHLTFKNQDKQNRDYVEQNALLAGDLAKFAELQGPEAIEQWMMVLPHLPLGGRLQQIDAHRPNAKFFKARKTFVWGQDMSMTGHGVLVPPQSRPEQYGTIPPPEKNDSGIPEGKVGDCVHLTNIGGTLADQLWRLMGVYGEIVAAKLLYKNPGSAIVQYRDSNHAQAAIRALHGVNGFELNESKNANAMHWSGANTDLDKRMVNIMGTPAPMMHPSRAPMAPTCNLLLWSSTVYGFKPGMEQIFRDFVVMVLQRLDINQTALAPQQVPDTQGRASYVVVLPTVEAAAAVVAAVNGELAHSFPALSQYVPADVKVGAAFMSNDEAAEAFQDDDEGLLGDGRCETLFAQGGDDDDEGLGPRSRTLPAAFDA